MLIRRSIRPLALAACFAALTAAPVVAQVSTGKGKESSPVQKQYEQRLKEQEEVDRQYRATNRNTTGSDTSKAVNDPWANVRPAAQEKRQR